jgi:DNA-binding transcriptional LysR family regulator
MDMELRHLRYFAMVAEEGHVTRAAARLGMQQAPLSQQIMALERELDARLFQRKPRGVELTEAGHAFYKEAKAILASVEQAATLARRVARGEQGTLRLGLTTSSCFHPLVARTIRAFRSSHPQVKIQCEQAPTPTLIERLVHDKLDAAFIRSAVSLPSPLRLLRLLEEPTLAALPAKHRLTKLKSGRLTLKSMAEEAFVGYPRVSGAGLYDAIISACSASGFSPRIEYEAPQMILTLNLVAAGLGISIVPESLRRMRLDGVSYRELTGPQPLAQLNLATTDGDEQAPAVRTFARLALAEC